MDLWYWLINHSVSRHEADKKPTECLFDLYTWGNSQTKGCIRSWQKRILGHKATLDLEQFTDPEPLERRVSQVPLREDLDKMPKNFTVGFCPVLLQRNLQPFTRVIYTKGNENLVRWILI